MLNHKMKLEDLLNFLKGHGVEVPNGATADNAIEIISALLAIKSDDENDGGEKKETPPAKKDEETVQGAP